MSPPKFSLPTQDGKDQRLAWQRQMRRRELGLCQSTLQVKSVIPGIAEPKRPAVVSSTFCNHWVRMGSRADCAIFWTRSRTCSPSLESLQLWDRDRPSEAPQNSVSPALNAYARAATTHQRLDVLHRARHFAWTSWLARRCQPGGRL